MALSTATFAWYTANSQVSANTAQITATTAAGNLKISTDGQAWSESITFTYDDAKTAPMMPTAEDLSAWATATKAADGTITYNTSSVVPESYTFQLISLESDPMEGIGFTVTPTDGTDTASLRYAIVSADGDILATGGFDYLTATTAAATDATANVAASTADITVTATATTITVYLWHDGGTMANTEGGKTSSISIVIA